MTDAEGARSEAASHPELDALHARVRLLLLIAAVGWTSYGAQYLLGGRWPGVFHLFVGAVTLLLRRRAVPTAAPRDLELAVHAAAAASLAGLVGLGLLTGQDRSPANWFFATVPVFAIYTLSTRAMVAWLGLSSAALLVVHGSRYVFPIDPIVVLPSYEVLVAQLALAGIVLAAAIASRITNDRHIDALRGRERVIRVQSEEIRVQSFELQRARDAALEAVRVKSEFLAMMSHEIRTPLNAVLGMATLLAEDAETSPEQRDAIEAIRSSGEALLALVSDVLDLSKLEAEKLEIESRPVDVARCIEEAIDQVAPAAKTAGLELGYAIDDDCPAVVVSDGARLRQILVNLLGNGVKFTREGGVTVRASGRPIGDRVELAFEVADTGIGIDEERRHRLFLPFSQVDASTTRKYGGTGLGLAISKMLCELLGGTISVESEPGRGSIFRFTAVAAPADSPPAPALSRRGAQVLLVAEHPVTAGLLAKHVGHAGGAPRLETSREHALARARQGDLDCALLDLAGDPASDATFLAALVAAAPELPVVVHGRAPPRDEGRAAVFLPKPLKAARLREALGVALGEAPVPSRRTRPPIRSQRPTPTGGGGARTALVVDDNALNRIVAVEMIKRLGCEAHAVESGAQAIAALRAHPVDVVLMDVQMPEMDGFEATRRIKSDPGIVPSPRIVAMTASALSGDRERCLQAGMNDYVSKPVRPETLARALGIPAPASTSDETSAITDVLDAKTLEQLRLLETATGTPLLAQMASVFAEETPPRVSEIRAGLEAGDFDAIRAGAHAVRGSAGALGATRLFMTATELEEAALARSTDRSRRLFDLLEKDVARAIDAVERVVQHVAPRA